MRPQLVRTLLIGPGLFALASCGGGGSGVASIPSPPALTPPPAPAPAPPPPPPVLSSSPPVTVGQSTEFQTAGSAIRIRFDSSANRYEIMLPGHDWGSLIPKTPQIYNILDSGGADLAEASFTGSGKYAYTGFASVVTGTTAESFAYGIATAPADMPITGSASYTADLAGDGGGFYIGGSARFDFDFAKGTLGGFMQLIGNDPAGWGPYELGGQRRFVNTIYASGSPTFSGGISYNGVVDGSFSGLFTGPVGEELMGKWQVPFEDIYRPGTIVTGSGVFVGKKTP